MDKQNTFTACAPASIGNFSVGFDVLGAAIVPIEGPLLGDVVQARPAETFSLQVTGSHAHVVPDNPAENLVTTTYLRFVQAVRERRLASRPLALTLHKNLPIASGLGSSASSIVATLLAINHACGKPLNSAEMLVLAAELEGSVSGSPHYDNVAPALLGGLQLMTGMPDEPSRGLPFPEHWRLVVSFPGTAINTQAARAAIPEAVPLASAVAFGRNLANFIDALHRADSLQAAHYLQDPLAEPHRLALLKGYSDYSRAARQAGALAVGISGSGPTVFAVCDTPSTAEAIRQLAVETYCARPDADKTAFNHICTLDQKGARLL